MQCNHFTPPFHPWQKSIHHVDVPVRRIVNCSMEADLVDDHVCKDPVDRPRQQNVLCCLKVAKQIAQHLQTTDTIWYNLIECDRMINNYQICWEASMSPCPRLLKQNSMNVLQSVSDYTTRLEPIRIALVALAAASSASVAERCLSCLQPQVISLLKGWLWLKLGAKSMCLDLWYQSSQDSSLHIVISDHLIKESYKTPHSTGSLSNFHKNQEFRRCWGQLQKRKFYRTRRHQQALQAAARGRGVSSKTIQLVQEDCLADQACLHEG